MGGLFGWLNARGVAREAAAPDGPAEFDAIIAVGRYNVPQGVPLGRAIAAIRAAVSAIPGARSISVEHHPQGSAERAVEVIAAHPGAADPLDARRRVRAATAAAIASLDAFPPAVAAPMLAGFAERPVTFADPAALPAWSSPGGAPTPGASLREASDTALLAVLLARVTPDGAEAAARRAVERFGSFAAVLAQPEAELLKLPGIGTHSVAAIKLLHAAALRLSRAGVMDQPALTSFDTLIQYLTAVLAREPLEHFRILFLDAEGRIRADEAQARGTVNHTPVYPREVVRRALELGAASVIMVHNHPSGDPSPSQEDVEMTKLVRSACRVVGLEVQDHIIVGNGRWFSFSQEGYLAETEAVASPAKVKRRVR